MPEESSTTTNGADTTAAKSVAARKRTPKPVSKPKAKAAKKKAAKKNGPRRVKKKAASKKKTAATRASSSSSDKAADKRKKTTGRYPTASLRFLLLREKHPEESAAAVARMVYCSPNQITKVKENKEKYEKMIAEMSEEKRQELLTTFIPKQTRGGKKPKKARENDGGQSQLAAVADNVARATFRHALRIVGLARAHQLLQEFAKEE